MAELATIARPYAEALFKAANADLNAAAVWLDELAVIAQNGQLQQFASNPKVSSTQVYDLIAGLMKATLSEQGKNFLRTVIDNGRLEALPEIAVAFRSLKNAKNGLSDAVVYSAFPIDAAALAEVAATLEKRFGRKLNVSVALDAELIGGIRVVVGDEVLDTCVKARLEQMKVALTA
ncbi:MAG: F0F1 ATP synthase subunit delta [Rhodoferax sp.]|nr:F0F1 ATP synthase subunit delta [Rhodoferax sp.]